MIIAIAPDMNRNMPAASMIIACYMLQANPGVVSTLENRMHHLESGDMVTFKEVKGMTCINRMTCRVEGGYNVSLAMEYHVACVGWWEGWVG